MKAYCVFENFSEEARKIITDNNIELTINSSKDRPNGKELIQLLEEYDILIMGVFSKLTANMI